MNCARCGRDIESDAAFCRFCGASTTASGQASNSTASGTTSGRRLVRLPASGTVAGVCAGIADHLGTDVTLVRLAWVILSIIPGAIIGGVIAYAAAWLLLPESPGSARPIAGRRLLRSTADRKIAGVCGGLAEYFRVDATVVRLAVVILSVYPGAIVGGLIAYLMAWAIIPPAPPLPFRTAAAES